MLLVRYVGDQMRPENVSKIFTPEKLKEVGEECFGPRWHTKTAKWLKVNKSTVGRWATGSREIHIKYEKKLLGMKKAYLETQEIIRQFGS